MKHLENPFLEAEVLLSFILHCSRELLKAHPEKEIENVDFLLYKKFVQKRKKRIPLAYITGKKEWMGMELVLTPKVLIPRDETEILCHHIASQKRKYGVRSCLDVGSGSGNIAFFLARQFPSARIAGIENSAQAFAVAQKNKKKLKLPVSFCRSDMLSDIKKGSQWDIITANLPYLPRDLEISPEVQQEPLSALFSGHDGLDAIRRLQQQLQRKKILFRELWMEFLPFQQKQIQKIFSDTKVDFFPDEEGALFFACVRGNI